MARKSSAPGDGLSEESLEALFEHVNRARALMGLAPLELASREFWSFSRDLHEAAAAYRRIRPTKAEFRKVVAKAVVQAGTTRKALIEMQHLVEPYGHEFIELRSWIKDLHDFESERASKRQMRAPDPRFRDLALHLKVTWEAATDDKARVSRPPEGASQQRPRRGPFANFVKAVLDVIDPSHRRTSIARSLEDILAKSNINKTAPKK